MNNQSTHSTTGCINPESWNPADTLPSESGVYLVLHNSGLPECNDMAFALYDADAKRWHIANWVDAALNNSLTQQIAGAIKLQTAPYSDQNYRWIGPRK